MNERSLLDPLLSQLSHTAKVVIILPKLHPLHEHEDRHFLNPRLGNTIRLCRKLRQRWRSEGNPNHVDQVPDIPYFFDIREEWGLNRVEEYERPMWLAGKDMERFADKERNLAYHFG